LKLLDYGSTTCRIRPSLLKLILIHEYTLAKGDEFFKLDSAQNFKFDTEHLESFDRIRFLHSSWLHRLGESKSLLGVELVTEQVACANRFQKDDALGRADQVRSIMNYIARLRRLKRDRICSHVFQVNIEIALNRNVLKLLCC